MMPDELRQIFRELSNLSEQGRISKLRSRLALLSVPGIVIEFKYSDDPIVFNCVAGIVSFYLTGPFYRKRASRKKLDPIMDIISLFAQDANLVKAPNWKYVATLLQLRAMLVHYCKEFHMEPPRAVFLANELQTIARRLEPLTCP